MVFSGNQETIKPKTTILKTNCNKDMTKKPTKGYKVSKKHKTTEKKCIITVLNKFLIYR
jgi:hypothetical protein